MDAIKEERFTPEQVAEAIDRAAGNITLAAKSLATTRSTLYNYLNRYPELKRALADTRESMIDHAESALRVAAIKGEGWAVCFMLKTIGRSRGYIERVEIDHRIDSEINDQLERLGLTAQESVSGASPDNTSTQIN